MLTLENNLPTNFLILFLTKPTIQFAFVFMKFWKLTNVMSLITSKYKKCVLFLK